MAATNSTSSSVSEFVLICLPGIQSWQHWISIPLALLFLVTLTANITLIATIYSAPSLHQPMYYFLCLFALVDLLMSISVSPKTLAILWFNDKTISPTACFTHLFIFSFCEIMHSPIFLFLAYDRYVAICIPLRHSTIITSRRTGQAALLSVASTTVFALPYPLLASRLHYCAENTVPHCFCQNLPLLKLACDISIVLSLYPLVVLTLYVVLPLLLIAFSYTMIIRAVLRLGSSEAAFKAFRTCSTHLILIGFLCCTSALSIISNRLEWIMPRYGHVLMDIFRFLTPTALNPLVYGVRTLEIRQAFLKLLGKMRQV